MARPKAEDPVVNKQLGLPKSLWAQVEAAAKAGDATRSRWIGDRLREAFGHKESPTKPMKRSPRESVPPSECRHPVGRRIGEFCGACGEKSKGGAR